MPVSKQSGGVELQNLQPISIHFAGHMVFFPAFVCLFAALALSSPLQRSFAGRVTELLLA